MSTSKEPKVILITGASSGLGQACARGLASQGHIVYGTARKPSSSVDTSHAELRLIPMDVGNAQSVKSAVNTVLQHEGRIDVLINNAGVGIGGALEDTSIAELEAQFDTNVFGVLRVCQQVLPGMRARGCGQIINISSMAGLFAIPFQGAYSASKYALEGLSEALRMEVGSFGISVVLVAPGDFKTPFTYNRRLVGGAENSPYYSECTRALQVMEKAERSGSSPLVIAQLVERIVNTRRPRLRYTAGRWYEKLCVVLKRWLPDALFEQLIRTNYRL